MNIHKYILLLTLTILTITVSAKKNVDWQSLPTDRLMDMGRQYVYNDMADSALYCFNMVIKRYETDSSIRSQYMRAMVNSGIVYSYHYHDYPKAYECLSTASDMAREHSNDSVYALVMVNMVDLMTKYYQDYPSASVMMECRKSAITGFNAAYKSRYWPCLVMNFLNIADSDPRIELQSFRKIFDRSIPDSVTNLQYARNLYRAIEASQHGRYSEARRLIRNNFTLKLYSLERERYYVNNYRRLSEYYSAEKKYGEALEMLDSALVLAKDSRQYDMNARIYLRKSKIYETIGDSQNTKYWHSLYLEARDSLNQLGKLQNLLELNFLHEISIDNQEMERMHDRHRRLITILVASSLITLVLSILCFIIYRQKRRLQVLNKSLYERIQNEIMPPAVTKTKRETKTGEETKAKARTTTDDDRMEQLWQRILQTLDDIDLICSPDFSQSVLANAVGSNVKYVSTVVNERSGKNFTALLSERRMAEACRRMNDIETYGRYTVEAISQSLGFKSRVTFINAFKRQYSLTPSEYMRIAKEKYDEQKAVSEIV